MKVWGRDGLRPVAMPSLGKCLQSPSIRTMTSKDDIDLRRNIRFGEEAKPEDVAYGRFEKLMRRLQGIAAARALMDWDKCVYMPEGGEKNRPDDEAALSEMAHEIQTSPKMGALLKELNTPGRLTDPIRKDIVRIALEDYEREKKLSAGLVERLAKAEGEGYLGWSDAKQKTGDFTKYMEQLEKIKGLHREKAQAYGYMETPYDALLDVYEKGMSVKKLDKLFGDLRAELVPLVKAIQASPVKPNDAFRMKRYEKAKQLDFINRVLTDMGYDFKRGRQDLTVHPFQTSIGAPFDVRITTKIKENDLLDGLYSSMHEAGHALYEQGVDEKLAGSPLAAGTSLGIHESQSRMWENMVGRSQEFWKKYYPILQDTFPRQLKGWLGNLIGVPLAEKVNRVLVSILGQQFGQKYSESLRGVPFEQFVLAVNNVKPSLIRIEADEATYNQHVMVRYEVEKAMLNDNLPIADVPAKWNEAMQDYLGVTPQNHGEGAFQDVHWSAGLLGYFPTYTLGNLAAAQFFHKAKAELDQAHGTGYFQKQIEDGNFKVLQNWLQEKIHGVGRREEPDQIMQRVTGEPLNAKYFVDYLWEKYGRLYKLDVAKLRPQPIVT
jgi:carboxypeptidase Taq